MTDDGSAPRSNVNSTFQQNTMPPETSAAPAPQYGMLMNYYNVREAQNSTVRMERSDRSRRPVRPVPTGQTDSWALVAYPASPEPITSILHVLADFGQMNSSYTMPPQSSVFFIRCSAK